MQPGKKIESSVRSKSRYPIKTHHLSSFGILNRNGLEMTNESDLAIMEEKKEEKTSEFSEWSMPEQRPGYIQGRLHDFF